MKKLVYLLVVIGLVLMSQPTQAQFKNWGTKFGFSANALFPENEFSNVGFGGNDDFSFDSYKLSYLIEGFIGVEFTRAVELQFVLGYGTYSGKAINQSKVDFGEYQTTIIPVNIRLRVSPWDVPVWNPYFYIGGGIMRFDINTKPDANLVTKQVDENGWVGIIPLGLGAEFALTDNVLVDISLGGGMSTSHALDGFRSGADDIWDSYFNVGLGFTLTGEGCSSDRDNDGLGKCDEENIGTDPKNPDTDGDGLNDGKEYLTYNTNPLLVDTDDDQLNDYVEVMKYKTDPLNTDTDGDGLKDGNEVLKYKTEPLKTDTDLDSLSDGDEVLKYETDPLKFDTDGDKLSDGDEVLKYKTDPLNKDTDGDGLTDFVEIMTYKTDPLKVDTDGGTVNDGTEVNRGTDPLDPKDDVVKINVPIVLEGINFATDKYEITPKSETVLENALKTLQTHPDITVEISGHTDNVGSDAYNQKLSQRRAEAVKAWLVAKGISEDRIITVGYGEERPRFPNDSPDNRRLNRRIEIKRIK